MASFVFNIQSETEERIFEDILNRALQAAHDYISVRTTANTRGLIKTIDTECRFAMQAICARLPREAHYA
ncbi:hypothetical protein WNY37_13845 [Henriciella sp. AS95]|uniref:hypothetical protein n=1 Tax=Henriciella sp. AS95 TaxID=3135782 RepID=UPI003172952E